MKCSFSRIMLITVAGLLAATVWYVGFFLPTAAEAEWQDVRSDLLAEGEKLSAADFFPPLVTDERNFFADPLWEELSDRAVATKQGIPYSKVVRPMKEWKISVIRQAFDESQKVALERRFPEFGPLETAKNQLSFLRTLWENAEKAGDTQRAAEFILEAQAPTTPIIARLRELGERPDARFPLEYNDGMLMGLEHAPILFSAGQWLELHASALLAQGRPAEAFRDASLLFRLAETLDREPLLISLLVELNVVRSGLNVVHRGVKTHAWSDAELRAFDGNLKRIDVPSRLADCLRLERAMILENTWPLAEKYGSRFWQLVVESQTNSHLGAPSPLLLGIYDRYWKPGDKILFSRTIQQWVDALEQTSQQGLKSEFFPDPVQPFRDAPRYSRDRSRYIMSLFGLASFGGDIPRLLVISSLVAQARIGIAQERYWLKYGRYPETLDALAPEFLPALPRDFVTQCPFSHRREANGAFTLWSVGWNETDEGGVPAKKPTEGDWVWGK